ncbi:MAG: hypothetical protein WAW06_00295 [bacterium]
MASTSARAAEAIGKLAAVRRTTLAVGFASALAAGLVIVGLAWLAVSLLDMGLGLGGPALRVVATVMLALAVGAVAASVVRVLRVSHSIRSYAARVGRDLKEVGLDLVTLLDLAEIDNRKFGYSETLIAKAMAGIAERVRGFDLQASVRKRALLLYCAALALLALGALVWWRLDPARVDYSLERLAYFCGLSGRSGIEITVRPGDRDLLAGSDLEVTADVRAFLKSSPKLHVLLGGQERAYSMTPAESAASGGRGRFTNTLAKIDRDLSYFVAAGGQATQVFRISVREEPGIVSGKITLDYPAHTGLADETLARGSWDITAPFGTGATFALAANCRPESAWIAVAGEGGKAWREPLRAISGTGDSLVAEMRLAEDLDFTLELAAEGGLRARPHGPHAIRVIPDKSPYVRIESPGKETMLEADMIIPLSVVALDDYGIAAMKLHYEFKGGTGEIDLAYNGKAQARCDYTWDVARLDVFPGDAVSYYVVVVDNDALTGPKQAKTDVYVARVPTVYELYEAIEERQSEDVESLEEVAEEAREAKENLEEIAEDIKREAKAQSALGWEQEQALKQNLARQDDVAKQLEDISSSLDETMDMMSENNLVNFAVLEKMEEIRQLIQEVASEDLMRAMEKMREAMAQLSPEEIRAAMENLNITQEDLLRKLEQAIAMLKRMKAEQKMEAAVKLAADIAEGQKQANDLLRDRKTAEAESKERGLAQDTARLREMTREVADLLRAQSNPVAEEVDKAGQFMDANQIEAAMRSMLAKMSAGRPSDALQDGEGLSGNLDQLAAMLKAAGDAMMNDERKQIMDALKETVDGLRDVSARQEEVLAGLEVARTGPARSELARREIVYKEAVDRIAEKMFSLSQKSLFVSPSIGRAILEIGRSLEAAAKDLGEATGRQAGRNVKGSLGAINTMVTGLMDAMDKASSCSSPGGMAEAFESLENMCGMQLGINQGTQQMLGEGEQGLSMEARAQMARLAAQQEAVKEGLEDLTGQYGDRTEILGRLDDLIEEAKRVIEDLKRQSVSEETLRRQERILTRMLDAQKSLRRREYSQRRKSRPGEVYQVTSPPALSLEEREAAVRDLLYRGSGYYPPEYEELIRAYFKAISGSRPGPTEGAGRGTTTDGAQ